jgi:hypothetical protein
MRFNLEASDYASRKRGAPFVINAEMADGSEHIYHLSDN